MVGRGSTAPALVQLQRSAGNRAVGTLVREARSAPVVQRFNADEHKSMGDTGARGALIDLAPGLRVTFGDITAMAGDYFGSVSQMRKLAATPGNGRTPGTRDELDYVFHVKIREEAMRNRSTFGEEVAEAVEARYLTLAGSNLTHFTEPSSGDTGRSADDLAKARRTVPAGAQGAYGTKAGAKVTTNNLGSYRENHIMAIATAAAAGRAGRPSNEALIFEAFASHFLTDAYASGHVRTPRSAISEWWNPKVPMFWTNLKLWMAEVIAKHINDNSAIGYGMTVQMLYESAQNTLTQVTKTLPTLTFGDAISGAVHDFDNTEGVVSQIGADKVALVGDGQILDDAGRIQAQGAPTHARAANGVKVSLDDVKTAYAEGKKGQPTTAITAGLRTNGMFRAEQLWPRAVPDTDAAQTNPRLFWKRSDVEDLFGDRRMSSALQKFANEKSGTIGAIGLDPPFKAAKETALRATVVAPMNGSVQDVVDVFRAIVNYTPGSATGATGGVFGHDEDDDALSYYRRAKRDGALSSLTLVQRKRLIRLVLSGATVGGEETMITDLLDTAPAGDLVPTIDSVSMTWLWSDLGGGNLRHLVHTVAPRYWPRKSLGEKSRHIGYHARGRTSERAEEMIVVILRTCTPAEVRALARTHSLDWNLDGAEQRELDRLRR